MNRNKSKKKRPLTEQQKKAAALFFDGKKVGEVAALVGVHRCTIWRWYGRRDFQREISRVADKYCREKRRAWLREYHNSPEYKREQNRKYYARRRLKVLAERLEKAGNSGNMAEYWKIAKEYDKAFNTAYFGGKTPMEYLKLSRLFTSEEKPRKEKKYIIKIV